MRGDLLILFRYFWTLAISLRSILGDFSLSLQIFNSLLLFDNVLLVVEVNNLLGLRSQTDYRELYSKKVLGLVELSTALVRIALVL